MSLRILLINWQDIRHPLGGGAEVHAHEILKRLVAAGHEVTQLSCTFRGCAPEEVVDGIRIVRRGPRPVFNYFVPALYAALCRSHTFDVVLEDINKVPFYTPLYARQPVVAIVHHLFGPTIRLETGPLRARYVEAHERLIPRLYRHTRFIAVSKSTQRELAALGLRCSPEDIAYNAVNRSLCRPRPELRAAEPTVAYFGRVKRYKCIDRLLVAFGLVLERMPEARLLIVGEGDARPELQRLAEELRIADRVTFTGAVSEERKAELLNSMWVMVNPSAKEGWGITVLEASACGVPVVAADSPGLRDAVVDGRTGLLYPWDRADILAQKLCLVLQNRPLRTRLGEGGQRWAAEFSWEKSAARVLEIISEELKR
ncbi:MAG: glycosyltransferase family 4 protein [Calditrichaeota bacterium]|nr:glycosyltransferase family 4 protein [Calditrichota bacterium]